MCDERLLRAARGKEREGSRKRHRAAGCVQRWSGGRSGDRLRLTLKIPLDCRNKLRKVQPGAAWTCRPEPSQPDRRVRPGGGDGDLSGCARTGDGRAAGRGTEGGTSDRGRWDARYRPRAAAQVTPVLTVGPSVRPPVCAESPLYLAPPPPPPPCPPPGAAAPAAAPARRARAH